MRNIAPNYLNQSTTNLVSLSHCLVIVSLVQIFLTTVLQHLHSPPLFAFTEKIPVSHHWNTLHPTPHKGKKKTIKVCVTQIFQNFNSSEKCFHKWHRKCIQLHSLHQLKNSYYHTMKMKVWTKRPVPTNPLVLLTVTGNEKSARLTRKV